MELVKIGNKLLKEVSSEVVFPLSDDDKRQIEEVSSFMEELNPRAQGFTAIQAGIKKRFAILKLGTSKFVIINPVIVRKVGIQISEESCTSVDRTPDVRDYYKLKRPMMVEVEYLDVNGLKHNVKVNKHDTRVYCHEIDHMDGILITEKGKFFYQKKIK